MPYEFFCAWCGGSEGIVQADPPYCAPCYAKLPHVYARKLSGVEGTLLGLAVESAYASLDGVVRGLVAGDYELVRRALRAAREELRVSDFWELPEICDDE